MSKSIGAKDLNKEIKNILSTYSDEIIESSKLAVDEITDESLVVLKDHAPVKSGKYKKTLSKKNVFESLTEKYNILGSDKNYRLPHLLENGHQMRNGGRSKAYPHFKYAEEYITNELPKRVEESIKGGL